MLKSVVAKNLRSRIDIKKVRNLILEIVAKEIPLKESYDLLTKTKEKDVPYATSRD